MCRGKAFCSELGQSNLNWDKYCPLPMPNWFKNEIEIFEMAVKDFLSGKRGAAISKLNQIRNEEITSWYIEHGQMSGRHRKNILNVNPPLAIPIELRDSIRSPKRIQKSVFLRDGYRCRYCGTKLISQDFMRLFIKKLNSSSFQLGKTNLTRHGILHITWPVADHVIPWNKGGRTDLTNLVSSCATCNYGKDGYTIEQLGIQNPLQREPIIDEWDGLTSKIDLLNSY